MLALSFPCVVTRLRPAPPITACRTWVQGEDLYSLALAATKQLDAGPNQCRFTLVSPDLPPRRIFLEVVHRDAEALVGPMAGPALPAALQQQRLYRLEDLVALLGLGEEDSGGGSGRSRYMVIVKYVSFWDRIAYPPVREEHESDDAYRRRYAAVDELRLERASREGFHVITHDVRPCEWTAYDLEMLMALAYQCLPTSEGRWPESGVVSQEPTTASGASRSSAPTYCLKVARGEYVAFLRLPAFPTHALVEWLDSRPCEIDLRHPVQKLELLVRHPPGAQRRGPQAPCGPTCGFHVRGSSAP